MQSINNEKSFIFDQMPQAAGLGLSMSGSVGEEVFFGPADVFKGDTNR